VIRRFSNSIDEPKILVTAKGLAIAAVCIRILVAVDHEVCGGMYTDQALQMLRQIGYSFGY
jgi:hypothetical protein